MNDCMLLKKGESMEKENYQFEYYAGSNFYFTNLMFILVMFGFGIVAFISIYMDILYLIKNIFKEKESKVPILAGKKDEFVFRIDDEQISIPWKDIQRISYKKRSEYSSEGHRSVKHCICPYTQDGPDYEISIDKLDEDQYDIYDVLNKYHPEILLTGFLDQRNYNLKFRFL